MTSAARPALGIVLLLLVLCTSVDAGAVTRVLLLPFSGRKAEVLRDKVEQGLTKAGYSVVAGEDPSPSVSASKMRGTKGAARADLMVSGVVRRHNMRLWTASLTVSTDDGSPVGDPAVFRSSWLPGLAKELVETSAARLEERFEQAKEPPSASVAAGGDVQEWDADKDPIFGAASGSASAAVDEPTPTEPLFSVDSSVLEQDTAEPANASLRKDKEAPVLKLRARLGMMRRKLEFVDDIYTRLRPLSTNALVYQVDGALFPFTRPFGEYLGIIFSYERARSNSIEDNTTGTEYTVGFEEFYGGLRARKSVGQHEVGFDLTLGSMRSELFDAGRANTPDFGYTLLRTSLDGTLNFQGLQLSGALGFRLPLGYGEVSEAEWFPRVGGYGVEGTLGVGYQVTRLISVELSGAMRRYILEMNSEPDDATGGVAEVAGGAVDLYLSGYFGVALTL
jgi:hypothetical protein